MFVPYLVTGMILNRGNDVLGRVHGHRGIFSNVEIKWAVDSDENTMRAVLCYAMLCFATENHKTKVQEKRNKGKLKAF